MTDQIQTILRKEGINASQLAEKLGIQRSSISHILSERNKPSLDFIQKVIDTFPHINALWLLTNKGSYSTPKEEKKTEEKTIANPSDALDISTPIKPKPPTSFDLFINTSTTESPTPKQLTNEVEKKDSFHIATKDYINTSATMVKQKKAIKVITFYSDYTFEEFFPS